MRSWVSCLRWCLSLLVVLWLRTVVGAFSHLPTCSCTGKPAEVGVAVAWEVCSNASVHFWDMRENARV